MPAAIHINELDHHVGRNVTLRGWVYGKRSGGKIVFLLLRDGTGYCQCVVEAKQGEVFERAEDAGQESSVVLSGVPRKDHRAPGGFEVAVTDLSFIQAVQDYPIARKAHGVDFLLRHRHLWLRSQRQARILRIRHTLIQAARRFFDERGFTLVDTPILSPGAAEGAGTLFALDYFGDTVYLTQTGQLYLESAIAALGKVYCFGPTFRAERSKTRRHLTEFWMIEPEIAFAELPDLLQCAEAFVSHLIEVILRRHREDLQELGRDPAPLEKVKPPFPRLTYSEAVDFLRSREVTQTLEREIEEDKTRLAEWMDELAGLEAKRAQTSKAWQQEKIDRQIGDLRERIRELEEELTHKPVHLEQVKQFPWGKDLGGAEETILSKRFEKPVLITEYPKDAKAFYMKRSSRNPDAVLNLDMLAPEGYGEIIGGSQREESLDRLVERMEELQMDTTPYEWYLDLRRYGSVPHGGFGLGIERTLAWVCGLRHVREAIPFPRLMGKMYP